MPFNHLVFDDIEQLLDDSVSLSLKIVEVRVHEVASFVYGGSDEHIEFLSEFQRGVVEDFGRDINRMGVGAVLLGVHLHGHLVRVSHGYNHVTRNGERVDVKVPYGFGLQDGGRVGRVFRKGVFPSQSVSGADTHVSAFFPFEEVLFEEGDFFFGGKVGVFVLLVHILLYLARIMFLTTARSPSMSVPSNSSRNIVSRAYLAVLPFST